MSFTDLAGEPLYITKVSDRYNGPVPALYEVKSKILFDFHRSRTEPFAQRTNEVL